MQVSLVELSRRQASPLSLLLGGASALNFFLQFSQTEIGSKVLESLLKGAPLPGNTSSGVLARMDAISVDGVGTKSAENAGDMRFVSQSIEDSSLWSSLLEIMADFL